jgi:deoxyadenosine/deoxycytidine kinase
VGVAAVAREKELGETDQLLQRLAHAQRQVEQAGTSVEKEYWQKIAFHWLELLRASAGDDDDQPN